MATSAQATHEFDGDYATVFAAVCEAAQANGLTVTGADPAIGALSLSSGVSAFSWGESADVRVWRGESSAITVAVRSKLKFGLVDWGKNKKNIARLFAAIDEILDVRRGGGPAAATPAGWYPDPGGRHQSRYWDGAGWTDQVADNGIIGSESL